MFRNASAPSSGSTTALNLVIMGDSRMRYGYRGWKNVSTSNLNGVGLDLIGTTGSAITADSSGGGTVKFYAGVIPALTWTAPGDTEGARVPVPSAGIYVLESATANMGIRVGYFSTPPVTNQTITCDVSGTMRIGYEQYGLMAHCLGYLRHPFTKVIWGGIGSSGLSDTYSQCAGQFAGAGNYGQTGAGFDVIWSGTNDIATSTALGTCTANMQSILDVRRAAGRKIVIIGEHARWGVNTSTALTVGQLAVLIGLNAFSKAYAAQYPDQIRYVDSYALSADPAFTDGRPKAGTLRDVVHPNTTFAKTLGEAVAAAFIALGCAYGTRDEQGDTGNCGSATLNSWFTGTTGAKDTGASGTVPTGWRCGRASGADATVVSSVVSRTDTAGNWWQLVVTGTTTGQIIQFNNTNGATLAQLGCAVGDWITPELELEGTTMTAIEGIDFFVQFTGASGTPTAHSLVNPSDGGGLATFAPRKFSGPSVKIPTGTTSVDLYGWIYTLGSASATVHIANLVITKGNTEQF